MNTPGYPRHGDTLEEERLAALQRVYKAGTSVLAVFFALHFQPAHLRIIRQIAHLHRVANPVGPVSLLVDFGADQRPAARTAPG
jgi:hypothetical protein